MQCVDLMMAIKTAEETKTNASAREGLKEAKQSSVQTIDQLLHNGIVI